MTDCFYIAHATDGRTRIRWAGEAEEKVAVIEVAEWIAAIEGVTRTAARLASGSIIIEHDETDWPTIESRLKEELSLQFTPPVTPTERNALEVINLGLDQINRSLKGLNTDLGSTTVFLLVMLAIYQALRGNVMVSSFSLLWYALSIAVMARNSASAPTDQTDPEPDPAQ